MFNFNTIFNMKTEENTKKEEMKKEKTAGNAVVFENPEFGKILTQTDENGEPLFCAKDVCNALGYKKPRNAVNQLVNPLDALKQGAWVSVAFTPEFSQVFAIRPERLISCQSASHAARTLPCHRWHYS